MFDKVSTKKVITEVVTKTYREGINKYVEAYRDGVLVAQDFTTTCQRKSHPYAYEPKSLHFQFFEDTTFLNNKELASGEYYKVIPEPSIIQDIAKLTKAQRKNILAIHLSMDGWIYRLESPFPVSVWQYCDYIGGFTNENFDLVKLQAHLEKISWVEDIRIINIPWYNSNEKSNQAIEFFFRPPDKLLKSICTRKKKISTDMFGIQGIFGKNPVDPFKIKKFYKE